VNPAVVVLTVALVTYLMRRRTALTSMTVGMIGFVFVGIALASAISLISSGAVTRRIDARREAEEAAAEGG